MQPPKCPTCGKLLTEELADVLATLSRGNSAAVWCGGCERQMILTADDGGFFAAAVHGPIPRCPSGYN